MDTTIILELVILVILVCLSAYFSSTETAMTTVNTIKIKALASEGDRRAKKLLKVLDNSGKMLSMVLICNNIVNLSASSLATTLTIRLFGNFAVGIGTGVLTLVILIFGEITPKQSAMINAEKLALKNAGIISLLMTILTPLIFIVNVTTRSIIRLRGYDPDKAPEAMTESEFLTVVDESHRDGVIENEERVMINNVVDFGDTEAKDIMIPWIDVTSASTVNSYEELIEIFKEHRFTRLPIHEEGNDHIVGILNMKDLLLVDREDFSIDDVMRPAYFTFEKKKVSGLLNEMKENSLSIVVVIDEYGTTSGIITMENVLEEIVGDIDDEYAGRDLKEIEEIVPGKEFSCIGSMTIDDLNEVTGLELDKDEYETIGGYIIEHSQDRIPQVGEYVTVENGAKLIVEAVKKNRITRVHIYIDNKALGQSEDVKD